jgi:hypothetical protein
MTHEIIKLETLELQLAKEFLVDENNIKKIQGQIDDLKKNVYDFSTLEGIKEAKELKTKANKFVKELKEFCEPLEADGKKIANARSAITTKLATGKDAVIDQILAPIYEREEKIKAIKNKLFIPSLNAGAVAEKLAEIEALAGYDWLAFKDEAEKLLEQHKGFLTNEKIKFDEEARLVKEAEEKARLERENQIRLEAEARANAQAELRIKQESERLELEKQNAIRAEQDKAEAEKRKAEQEAEAKRQTELRIKQEAEQAKLKEIAEAERLAKNKEHQAKIHNEILEDILRFLPFSNQYEDFEERAKKIVKFIAKGEIRNLKIIY